MSEQRETQTFDLVLDAFGGASSELEIVVGRLSTGDAMHGSAKRGEELSEAIQLGVGHTITIADESIDIKSAP